MSHRLVAAAALCVLVGAAPADVSPQQASTLQPDPEVALVSATGDASHVSPCTEDSHCGEHGVCTMEEGNCFCDLGFSGRTCSEPSSQGTARGSTDALFWTNLTLSSVRAGGSGGGGGGGGPMMGLLGGPTATSWFNPFAATPASYNPFAAAAEAAKRASRSVLNPFATPPAGSVSFVGGATTEAANPMPASPWGFAGEQREHR